MKMGYIFLFLFFLTAQEDINSTQKPRKLWSHLLAMLVPASGLATAPHDDEEYSSFPAVILDLTSGSGSLTMACAEAGFSSIAFESDPVQALASAILLDKFFSSSGLGSKETFLEEDEDPSVQPAILQQQFQEAFENAGEEQEH
jgi:hypothetical protein